MPRSAAPVPAHAPIDNGSTHPESSSGSPSTAVTAAIAVSASSPNVSDAEAVAPENDRRRRAAAPMTAPRRRAGGRSSGARRGTSELGVAPAATRHRRGRCHAVSGAAPSPTTTVVASQRRRSEAATLVAPHVRARRGGRRGQRSRRACRRRSRGDGTRSIVHVSYRSHAIRVIPPHGSAAGEQSRPAPAHAPDSRISRECSPGWAGATPIAAGVRLNRGAGAGWTRPSTSTNVRAGDVVRVAGGLRHRQHRGEADVGRVQERAPLMRVSST